MKISKSQQKVANLYLAKVREIVNWSNKLGEIKQFMAIGIRNYHFYELVLLSKKYFKNKLKYLN